MLEEHVSGTPRVQYVWSVMYLDQMVLRDRDSDSNGSLEERIYPTHDANYNVTGLVDDEGTVLQRFMYDPYGKRTVLAANWSGTSDAYVFLHGFQGGRHDPVTNRVHFRFREHDVDLMRPASADPLGNPDGANRYQWEMSNPVGMVDPYGLDPRMYYYGPEQWEAERKRLGIGSGVEGVSFATSGGAGGQAGGGGAAGQSGNTARGAGCGCGMRTLRRPVANNELTPEEQAEANRVWEAGLASAYDPRMGGPGAAESAARMVCSMHPVGRAGLAAIDFSTGLYAASGDGLSGEDVFWAGVDGVGNLGGGKGKVARVSPYGPRGGLRNPSDIRRMNDLLKRRAARRKVLIEDPSRAAAGQKPVPPYVPPKGPSGQRPCGPSGAGREKNVGIDDEHSRVAKGSHGMPRR